MPNDNSRAASSLRVGTWGSADQKQHSANAVLLCVAYLSHLARKGGGCAGRVYYRNAAADWQVGYVCGSSLRKIIDWPCQEFGRNYSGVKQRREVMRSKGKVAVVGLG